MLADREPSQLWLSPKEGQLEQFQGLTLDSAQLWQKLFDIDQSSSSSSSECKGKVVKADSRCSNS